MKAILSYAYAVLQSHVRIATVSQGLDPYIGYLHAIRLRRLALVYDLMEPPCPRVDHLVLGFVRSHMFSSRHFMLGTSGVRRLYSQLARRISRLDVNDTATQERIPWL